MVILEGFFKITVFLSYFVMKNFLDKTTEIIGWIQIVISATLVGIALGAIFYALFDNQLGLIFAMMIVAFCLIYGIVFATKKLKTTGTIHFLSSISSTPELNDDKKS